jgi:hypothetical protein
MKTGESCRAPSTLTLLDTTAPQARGHAHQKHQAAPRTLYKIYRVIWCKNGSDTPYDSIDGLVCSGVMHTVFRRVCYSVH